MTDKPLLTLDDIWELKRYAHDHETLCYAVQRTVLSRQAEQSSSAEDARRIAILSAALHLVRSMPDWDARPDGSLEPFAEMMDMALRGEVHDILSFIEYVHATYPVADGAAMKGQP